MATEPKQADSPLKNAITVVVALVVVGGVAARLIHGNGDSREVTSTNASTAQPHATARTYPEDEVGVRFLNDPQLFGGVCEKLADLSVIFRVRGTASANNMPAHVVGYKFTCRSPQGNQEFTQYLSWMENTDTNKLECVMHNVDRDKVMGADAFYACGGNFKPER